MEGQQVQLEMSQAKREIKVYIDNVSKSKEIDAIISRKRKRQAAGEAEEGEEEQREEKEGREEEGGKKEGGVEGGKKKVRIKGPLPSGPVISPQSMLAETGLFLF